MKKVMCVLLAAVGLLAACAPAQNTSRSFFGSFDTMVTVTARGLSPADFDRLYAIVEGEFTRLHRLYSAFENTPGGIGDINAQAGAAANAAPEVLELLAFWQAQDASITRQVNPLLGEVTALWRAKRESALQGGPAKLPDDAALQAAGALAKSGVLMLDESAQTITLPPGVRLDAGAIAKGYAVRLATQAAQAAGFNSFIINAGGNIMAAGAPSEQTAWQVGIEAPDNFGAESLACIVSLENMAVATSGDYQRYYQVDGVRYCHIIAPDTLYPPRYCRAVTVLCPDAALADLLSTALFTLDIEAGQALCLQTGVDAIWLLADGRTVTTPGALAFINE